MKKFFRIFSAIIPFAIHFSCALQLAPQGGEKDTKPPVLVTVTPASGSTGFAAKEIVFEFDEFIQVKDASSKLIVSPPLDPVPVVRVRRNRMTVLIDDTLRPNTTYSFNFGEAVSDLNEGNIYEGMSYVLSTGSYIDTLQFSGRIIRSEDLQAEKGMTVMLYSEFANDSVPYLERPLYFARTNDDGTFRISNLAPGWYKAFAVKEVDGNYLYNDPEERIAFIPKTFQVPDSGKVLKSFRGLPSPRLAKVAADGPGKIVTVFNRPLPKVNVRLLTDSSALQIHSIESSPLMDTIVYWYRNLTAIPPFSLSVKSGMRILSLPD